MLPHRLLLWISLGIVNQRHWIQLPLFAILLCCLLLSLSSPCLVPAQSFGHTRRSKRTPSPICSYKGAPVHVAFEHHGQLNPQQGRHSSYSGLHHPRASLWMAIMTLNCFPVTLTNIHQPSPLVSTTSSSFKDLIVDSLLSAICALITCPFLRLHTYYLRMQGSATIYRSYSIISMPRLTRFTGAWLTPLVMSQE